MQIVLASGNEGKAQEIEGYITQSSLAIELVTQKALNIDSAPETGSTFVENALLKGKHVSKHSGLPALADDSGLIIDCLKGKPGVYSARYGGHTQDFTVHMNKVINDIKALALPPHTPLTARFVCVLVLLKTENDPLPLICEGQWEGEITLTPRGNNGFGYDPIFYLPEHHCTAGELPLLQKNKISHRAKALQQFAQRFSDHVS